jgi:hypothetical protein
MMDEARIPEIVREEAAAALTRIAAYDGRVSHPGADRVEVV